MNKNAIYMRCETLKKILKPTNHDDTIKAC